MNFPHILVINLVNRKDRWLEMQETFASWPALERVDAVKMIPGHKGCTLSHKKCITIAKERNYPWVLVLEDDCVLTPNSLQRFKDLLPVLWERKNEWNIFLGGTASLSAIKVKQINPPLFHVKGLYTHFCLYNSNSYDGLIASLYQDITIDRFYRSSNSVIVWATVPHLAIQKSGVSDIAYTKVNYENDFSNASQNLSKILTKKYSSIKELLPNIQIPPQNFSLEGFTQQSDLQESNNELMSLLNANKTTNILYFNIIVLTFLGIAYCVSCS